MRTDTAILIVDDAKFSSAGYVSLQGCLQLEWADAAQSMPASAKSMLEAALTRLTVLPQEQRYGQFFWRANSAKEDATGE